MRIRLKQVGIISEANVELAGVTVIAGPNRSGKSTIGRVLMTYGTLLRRMDELVRNRKLSLFLKRLSGLLGLSELMRSRLRWAGEHDFSADELLTPAFWEDANRVAGLFKKLSQGMAPARERAMADALAKLDALEIQNNLQSVLKQDEGAMAHEIIEERFREVFAGQINSLRYPQTEADISLEDDTRPENWELVFAQDVLRRASGSTSVAFPRIIYLEPMHLMDLVGNIYSYRSLPFDRYGAGECSWMEILKPGNERKEAPSADEKERTSQMMLKLREILAGELAVKDGRLLFREQSDSREVSWIELTNLASGVKSLAIILQAIANYSLAKGTIFVMDEPEANLHPEWQIKFARVLVHLWTDLGVRVVVATHSPYFLKGLEVSAAEGNALDDLKCYFMEQGSDGAQETVAQDVTGQLNKVYKTFFEPLNSLMAGGEQ